MAVWGGKWVAYAADPQQDLGVFAFRTTLSLSSVPDSLRLKISADNRYKLYVNGTMVAFGPQRGDEKHWFYETVDIAPHLTSGENQIVALVWNFGRWAPMAQHTVRTGFVVDSDVSFLNTPGDWQVARLDDWGFDMMHSSVGDFYIDIGPGEIIPSFDPLNITAEWKAPYVISDATDRGENGGGVPWMLIPRTLPAMRYEKRIARPIERHGYLGESAPRNTPELRLAPGEKALLDYGELLCAYPQVIASGGELTFTYAEALWQTNGEKGNRDEVAGKEMRGYQDKLLLGARPATHEPLWWRTYRYLLIENTGQTDAEIEAIEAIETGFPFAVESSFEADDPWVGLIWDVSLRTAERCAGETYFDCPYYEQLQYVGDTRIQAMIGYYLGRDRVLQRNAVETLGWSIMENGLTQSRYPSRQAQVIPPFSLWWVMMLRDQLLYDNVKPNAHWSQVTQLQDNWIGDVRGRDQSFWNFADWVPGWNWGVPPQGSKSNIHYLTYALGMITERVPVDSTNAAEWPDWHLEDASKFIEAFNVTNGLVEMDAHEEPPTEHVEALFRLCQEALLREPFPWPTAELAAVNAAKCTFYFAYYKHLAMFGRQDTAFDYMEELAPWKEQIESGLSTFAENPEPTRSDCHAWSAHPMLGFFQIVAGVKSMAPGWKKAQIMPHPGSLKRFDARIAHPDGELSVKFEGGRFDIDSPVPIEFAWQGKRENMAPGRHIVVSG